MTHHVLVQNVNVMNVDQVSEMESAVDEGNVVDSDVNEDGGVVQVIYSTLVFSVVCSSHVLIVTFACFSSSRRLTWQNIISCLWARSACERRRSYSSRL